MLDRPTDTVPVVPESQTPPRRGFVAGLVAIVIGGLITLTPLFAGVVYSFDPICRKRPRFRGADNAGFLPGPKLSELPVDGTPVRFTIKADLMDAWNLFKDRTLGTVYLRNVAGTPIAFNDTCPHLGCKVNYETSTKSFYCPCHASAFALDGHKTNKIPPRDLDSLAVKVVDGQVWVKYEDFKGGEEKKEAIG